MAEPPYRVELAESFVARLGAIEAFLRDAGADAAFDGLLDALRTEVVPNLARFPRIGRRYLDTPPRSSEAIGRLGALPAGMPPLLREYLHGDYLLLYVAHDADAVVYLLTIRHHRELSFDLAGIWPGPGAEG